MAHQKILLIDYEPRSIERFRQPLTDAGYTVEVATDGVTGIEAFHRLSPDMVLVEAMIPKKHGFEVCQELKRTPHGRRTPVLITTGVYKGRKYRTQALHIYGCDEYIEKPIAPEQLLAVVGKFFTAGQAESRAASSLEATGVTSSDSMATKIAAPAASDTRPAPPKPPSSNSVMKDFTEEEIMARLDAILPGGEGPSAAAEAPSVMVTEADPVEIPLPIESPTAEEPDPFAQMQAELTAELGSLSTALALEPAPVFDAPPQTHPVGPPAAPPTVLEALPAIEEAPPTSAPAEPAAADPHPGQLVSFDARRSRRKKRGKHGGREQAAAPAPPQAAPPTPSRVTPIAESARPAEAARAGSFSLPKGTLAEAELAGTRRKPVPVWIWAALILVGLVVAYLTVSRSAPETAATAEPVDVPARGDLLLNSIEPLPAQASPAPQAAAPAPKPVAPPLAAEPQASAPKPADASDTAESKPTTPPQEKAASRNARTTTSSPIRNWLSSTPATAVPEAPPAAPAAADEGVAGVEAVIDGPVPAAAPAVAPGTLVDAAELDSAPVSLTRKLPMYSMQARQLRIQGTVIMKVLVNEQGTVDDVALVEGVPGADLNSSAMKAAKSWTYRPATKAGVPVKVWKVEQVTFKM